MCVWNEFNERVFKKGFQYKNIVRPYIFSTTIILLKVLKKNKKKTHIHTYFCPLIFFFYRKTDFALKIQLTIYIDEKILPLVYFLNKI